MTELDRFIQADGLAPHTFLGAFLYAVAFLLGAAIASRGLRIAVGRMLTRDEHGWIDRTWATFLTQLGQITIYLLAITFYSQLVPPLHRVGTALLAGVSVASIVIGLAAQNTLGNLVAGITILLYRPIRLDDFVMVGTPAGPEAGVVERLTLGYTLLRTADDRRIIVPNSIMASQVTLNLNARYLRAMAIVPVGVPDAADAERVRELLLEMARQDARVLAVVDCPVRPLGDTGAVVSLRAWCEEATTAKAVEGDLAGRARVSLTQQGIQVSLVEEPALSGRP